VLLEQARKANMSRETSQAMTLKLQPAQCWRAVLGRDTRWDGLFVYGVRSTGIYCRPSCASRRPGRAQVLFFAQPDRAEQAGFRPCRRCHPRDATYGRAANTAQTALVAATCRRIEAQLDGPVRLSALADAARATPHQLHRAFRRVMGITPRQYAEALRLGLLKKHLREGRDVTTALYEAGFSSSSRLYERSDAHLGMTPATYRRGGRGMRIGYAIADCPLGRLLLAATERGVSAVYFGDSDRPLEAALRREYPSAEIHRDPRGLSAWVRALVQHLGGAETQLDLPLDVAATVFQQRVWAALRRIPYGSTRTYRQIARALGRPSATRAVARACATNPVSVVVPCHRVVREDGKLAGYRWGLERKRALLDHEREVTSRLHWKGKANAEGGRKTLAAAAR
jgi:AraC family transcriptional regulator of adaptative response/methylated-DNA-[protein]-cysteine methyltransferase